MVTHNITIEDTSPIIVYNGAWSCNREDKLYTRYSGESFHATSDASATATLDFYGTAVYLFGARRANHGEFDVTVDGHTVRANGFLEEGQEEFQAQLYAEEGLPLRQHRIVLSNVGVPGKSAPWLDLDYVVVTTGDGKKGTMAKPCIVDDADQGLQWSQHWVTDEAANYGYDQTQHRTYMPAAWVNYTFDGSAIEVHATANGSMAPFWVRLDGGPSVEYKPNNADLFLNDSLVYFTSGLTPGKHLLGLMHAGSPSEYLGLDYLVVHSYDRKPLSAGSVVGITLGCLVALLAAILIPGAYYLRKRRECEKAALALEEARPFKMRLPSDVDDGWGPQPYRDPYASHAQSAGTAHASAQTFYAGSPSFDSYGARRTKAAASPHLAPPPTPHSGKRARTHQQRPPPRTPHESGSSSRSKRTRAIGTHGRGESQEVLLISLQDSQGSPNERGQPTRAIARVPNELPPVYASRQPSELLRSPPLEPNRRREKGRRR